ncbi:segregation/condensation protein A [Peptoniphilus equinus]|uniref:Segregation and condensation protein A n=1 Tax=Peptoniphilus equinus TaxID=3016343 RepID=A0ABY7QUZ1_9FIRM|nr:segregation/condensation protein A [Peptoniphilus equinus]WBW50602.1 segregation/condensation protein A [Peptoniphilus equinus]
MSVNITLQVYDGPYELLLDLIKKNELDIYDIEINVVTAQFLNYIYAAKELDLELTSDFLVVASTLVEIKSKMLLPKASVEAQEEEEDPRKELVQKLIEYENFKKTAELLRQQENYELRSFHKLKEDFSYLDDFSLLQGVSVDVLTKTFQNILTRYEKSTVEHHIVMDKFNVKLCMDGIYHMLRVKEKFFFTELLSSYALREEIISYFLALLEMCKNQLITLQQNSTLTDIWVVSKMEWNHE